MHCVILDWILGHKQDDLKTYDSVEVWSLEFNSKGNLKLGDTCTGKAFTIFVTFTNPQLFQNKSLFKKKDVLEIV